MKYIDTFTGIIDDKERTIYSGISIINGERQANVCGTGVIYKIDASTVVVNYQ